MCVTRTQTHTHTHTHTHTLRCVFPVACTHTNKKSQNANAHSHEHMCYHAHTHTHTHTHTHKHRSTHTRHLQTLEDDVTRHILQHHSWDCHKKSSHGNFFLGGSFLRFFRIFARKTLFGFFLDICKKNQFFLRFFRKSLFGGQFLAIFFGFFYKPRFLTQPACF